MLNQTFFKRILVGEEGTIEGVELTPVYAALAAWEPDLGRPAPTKPCPAKTAQQPAKRPRRRASRTNPDPILRGQGLYKTSMVEPTEVNANHCARLPGGRMSLNEAD